MVVTSLFRSRPDDRFNEQLVGGVGAGAAVEDEDVP